MKPTAFLRSTIRDSVLNLNNDYRYLKTGYYVSTHAEVLGNPVIPSSESIIDANRTPILLLKASKAGIPTLPYLVAGSVKRITSELGFPVVVFAVNPFSYDGFRIAKNRSALYRVVKSLSMNYKFAVCAQPLKGEMISFKSIFGRCEHDGEVEKISEKVFEVFKIPICKLHVQKIEDKAYLCGLQPLRMEEISPADLKIVCEEISRVSDKGEHLVG
jgi:formate-dependent phosphoribosylglycinamide formyltransferase (GAR transformylase)